ncbi:MAG: hypothetical protein U0R44_03520 [Candidatus Micrarchaeia archaeon]
MTGDNVTITRTKIPEGRYTSITVKHLEPMHLTVRLSADSEAYLRRMGYSQRFCDALLLLLNSMTNTVINTAENSATLRAQQNRSPYSDFAAPEQPIRAKMPADLRSAWMFLGLGEMREPLVMPFLAPYYPDSTKFPMIHSAFVSDEGQRFMKRYYTTGWLRQDERSGEWIVAPPARPHELTPRRH